ncbi:MAG: 30S ribosome-binding factor RbfA, partial [Clostridiales bacterium]
DLSVVSVDIAPDGCSAKVYFSSLLGGDEHKKEIEQALEKAKGYIRRELGRRLKTRAVPELYFHLDQSIEYGVKMTKIIEDQIRKDEQAAAERPEPTEGIYKE